MSKLLNGLAGSVKSGAPASTIRRGDDVYVLVDETRPAVKADEKTDEKVALPTPAPSKLHVSLRRGGVKKVQKDGMIRVRLWTKITQSSASGSALSLVTALQPPAADGWTDFGNTYDVARCLGVEFHTAVNISGASSLAVSAAWGVAFDPDIPGVMTSVNDVLAHKYRIGPVVPGPAGSGGPQQAVTPTGYHHFRAKTARSFESSVSADKVGSNWFPTASTTAIIGYHKPYADAIGSVTWNLVSFVSYDMEFKYRG